MNVDELRPALATPFPAVVLEIAHQFLLLRVYRYDRFVRRQERRRLRVDVLKLRVAIDVLAAFSCLVVRLQAVAHAAQKLADNRRANLMTLLRQLGHEVTQAPGRLASRGAFFSRPPPPLRSRPAGAATLSRMSETP